MLSAPFGRCESALEVERTTSFKSDLVESFGASPQKYGEKILSRHHKSAAKRSYEARVFYVVRRAA
jgi:hypothetical protein